MKRKFSTRQLVLCSLFTAMIAVGAFIQIPVPFMDYFTLQFLFVILAGMLLGARDGAISTAAYVAIGLIGFPVFAAGGGIQYIARPSFGFLIGFIVTAFCVGKVMEKFQAPRVKHYLLAALIGMAVTYSTGFLYKYFILNVYMGEVTPLLVIFLSAFPLDIPGDTALCLVASILANRLRHALKGAGYDDARA